MKMLKVTCSVFILCLSFATVISQPKVSPASYKEDESPSIQFTCSDASLKPGELLAWYQSRDVVTYGGDEKSVSDFSSYKFFPVARNYVRFRVRAPHNAFVTLTDASRKLSASYTVLILRSDNKTCEVRRGEVKQYHNFLCRGALSDAEFRGFWIRWVDGRMALGKEGDTKVLISWTYPTTFVVSYFGIHTGEGSTGTWKIEVVTTRSNQRVDHYFPTSGDSVRFRVKTKMRAFVFLAAYPREADPQYEISFGAWQNLHYWIQKLHKGKRISGKTINVTSEILSMSEFRGFWIRWENDTVSAGHEGDDAAFISWSFPEPFPVRYFGLSSDFDAISGTWEVEGLSKNSEDVLLSMTQLLNPGELVELVLKKTLEHQDHGTWIYCAKQSILPDGSFSRGVDSKRIPIKFQKVISPLTPPSMEVEPHTTQVYFELNSTLTFSCSSSHLVDGRTNTWLRKLSDSDDKPTIPESQKYEASTKRTVLELVSLDETYDRNVFICVQGYVSCIRNTGVSMTMMSKAYGEMAMSETITLIMIVRDGPRVSPDHFEEDDKPYVQSTCSALLLPGELLAWYQTKASKKSKDTLLRMTQHQAPGQSRVELNLKKTLEPSDNGTSVHCAKQSVLRDGSFSRGVESKRIPIVFNKNIQPLEPSIKVESDNASAFTVNSTRSFTCSGSPPVDGRIHIWFRKVSESDDNPTIPERQKYDASKNLTVMELVSLNETYDQNVLFCAQGYVSYIMNPDVSMMRRWIKFYGEMAKSESITLIMFVKNAEESTDEEELDKNAHITEEPYMSAQRWAALVVIVVVVQAIGAATVVAIVRASCCATWTAPCPWVKTPCPSPKTPCPSPKTPCSSRKTLCPSPQPKPCGPSPKPHCP